MKEINPQILTLLNLEDVEIKEFTSEQKKILRERFTPNLKIYGVYWVEGYGILFDDEGTHNNWLYYAGFEYIKDFDLIKVGGDFTSFFSLEHDRIAEFEEYFNFEVIRDGKKED